LFYDAMDVAEIPIYNFDNSYILTLDVLGTFFLNFVFGKSIETEKKVVNDMYIQGRTQGPPLNARCIFKLATCC